jgi:hypothetical protein
LAVKRILLSFLSLACHASEATPITTPLVTSTTAVDLADASIARDASSSRRAHADGDRGSVELVICPFGKEKWLGLAITPKQGALWRVALYGVDANTPDAQVRFVDVDHDGFPDPIVSDASRTRPNIASVYLTSTNDGAGKDCAESISIDRGSDGFLDEAATALAAVPAKGLTEKEVCAAIDATQRLDVDVLGYSGSEGALDEHLKMSDAVTSCHARVPDGTGFLHPVVKCDSFRPYCEFGLASGGTTIPASERRYWFDASLGKLVTVGVPQL